MQKRLQRHEREAIRNEYREHVAFRAVRDACTQFERSLKALRLSPEEVFVECFSILDQLKEYPEDGSRMVSTLWDATYNDLMDLDDTVPEEELQEGVTVILYMTNVLLMNSNISFYRRISAELIDQIVNRDNQFTLVQDAIMPYIYRLDIEKLAGLVDSYLDSDLFLSDEVEDVLSSLNTPEPHEKKADKKAEEQLTNRQLIILFEAILGISLSPADTNNNALAKLLSNVSGRSQGSIRGLISTVDYDNPQTKQDAEIVAELLKPLSPKIAQRISNNIE